MSWPEETLILDQTIQYTACEIIILHLYPTCTLIRFYLLLEILKGLSRILKTHGADRDCCKKQTKKKQYSPLQPPPFYWCSPPFPRQWHQVRGSRDHASLASAVVLYMMTWATYVISQQRTPQLWRRWIAGGCRGEYRFSFLFFFYLNQFRLGWVLLKTVL